VSFNSSLGSKSSGTAFQCSFGMNVLEGKISPAMLGISRFFPDSFTLWPVIWRFQKPQVKVLPPRLTATDNTSTVTFTFPNGNATRFSCTFAIHGLSYAVAYEVSPPNMHSKRIVASVKESNVEVATITIAKPSHTIKIRPGADIVAICGLWMLSFLRLDKDW
jgi:hypothetical protein